MKTLKQLLLWTGIILSVLNLVLLIFEVAIFNDIPRIAKPGFYQDIISYGILVFFVSHLIIIVYASFSTLGNNVLKIAGNILLSFGVISFVSLFFNFLAFDQILEEINFGYPYTGMLRMLWTATIIHFIFFLAALIFLLITLKKEKVSGKHSSFFSLNIIGITCGIMGILVALLFLSMFLKSSHPFLHRFLIVPYGFVLFPYILMLASWFYKKSGLTVTAKSAEMNSMNRSAMFTLPVSLAVILTLTTYTFLKADPLYQSYYFAGTVPVLWLPIIAFFSLLLFSAISLFKDKVTR